MNKPNKPQPISIQLGVRGVNPHPKWPVVKPLDDHWPQTGPTGEDHLWPGRGRGGSPEGDSPQIKDVVLVLELGG